MKSVITNYILADSLTTTDPVYELKLKIEEAKAAKVIDSLIDHHCLFIIIIIVNFSLGF